MAGFKRIFPTGGIVPPEDLVDRDGVIAELFERTYGQLNSVLLSAPRQTGKTSVAGELIRRVRAAGGWGVYIDCAAATGEEGDLAGMIARSTYDQASGSKGAFLRLKEALKGAPRPVLFQSDLDLSVTFHSPGAESPERRLERAFGLADELAGQKNKRCVVVYDEFQELAKISPDMFARARAALQHRMANTAYVFMGSEVGLLDRLFRNPKQMPFRLATPLGLPLPSADAWHGYLERRFRSLGVAASSDEIDRMIAFVGRHPRDLMEVCGHLLVVRTVNPSVPGAVELAEARTLDGLRAQFEESWKRLEPPKGTRMTAARIAHGRPVYGRGRASAPTSRTVEKLEREGVIRRIGRGGYEFSEPLFGVFVRQLTTMPE